jgi:pimeloyl-ACP methyl ester carboxylesterase
VITLRGLPTHVEVQGRGEPLVLLHGGYCSLEPMRPVADRLAERFTVHAAERTGHGRTPDREGPYHYADWILDTLALLDAQGLAAAHLVGYSDGAILALLLALEHPERVRSVTAISANLDPSGFDHDAPPVPEEFNELLDAQYAELSPDGAAHSGTVVAKLLALWEAEPQIPATRLAGITAPTLVMAGEHDLVAADHTRTIAANVPGAELEFVPGTTHVLVVEAPDLVANRVLEFLSRT